MIIAYSYTTPRKHFKRNIVATTMTCHSFHLAIMFCTTFLVSRNVGSPAYISRIKWPDDLGQIYESGTSLTHTQFYPIDHYEPLTNNIIDMRKCDSAFAWGIGVVQKNDSKLKMITSGAFIHTIKRN
jgi:hypothetical protein